MCYRWRYLSQKIGDWRTIPMAIVDSTQLVAQAGQQVSLNDGVGDLEYYFRADIASVFYKNLDFFVYL